MISTIQHVQVQQYTNEQRNLYHVLSQLQASQVADLAKHIGVQSPKTINFPFLRALSQAATESGFDLSDEGVQVFQSQYKLVDITILRPTLGPKTAQKYFKNLMKDIPIQTNVNLKINPSTLLDKLLRITGQFEGSGYHSISGNFDDQGLSLGILQWNFGRGTLQPMLLDMYLQQPAQFKLLFGSNTNLLLSKLRGSRKDLLKFSIGINTKQHQIKEPWRSQFIKLSKNSNFRQIQLEYAQSRFNKALYLMSKYQLKTERAAALMFDIVVQNGRIPDNTHQEILDYKRNKEATLGRFLSEKEFLHVIAVKRAEAAKPAFIQDVKTRKLAIVLGKGIVHGSLLHIDHTFDLSDRFIL